MGNLARIMELLQELLVNAGVNVHTGTLAVIARLKLTNVLVKIVATANVKIK